jgi:hypothetical protein
MAYLLVPDVEWRRAGVTLSLQVGEVRPVVVHDRRADSRTMPV